MLISAEKKRHKKTFRKKTEGLREKYSGFYLRNITLLSREEILSFAPNMSEVRFSFHCNIHFHAGITLISLPSLTNVFSSSFVTMTRFPHPVQLHEHGVFQIFSIVVTLRHEHSATHTVIYTVVFVKRFLHLYQRTIIFGDSHKHEDVTDIICPKHSGITSAHIDVLAIRFVS